MSTTHQMLNDPAHAAGHLISAGAILGVIIGALPVIASLGAAVWYAIVIYESRTVQTYLRARHPRFALPEGRGRRQSDREPHAA